MNTVALHTVAYSGTTLILVNGETVGCIEKAFTEAWVYMNDTDGQRVVVGRFKRGGVSNAKYTFKNILKHLSAAQVIAKVRANVWPGKMLEELGIECYFVSKMSPEDRARNDAARQAAYARLGLATPAPLFAR